MRLAQCFLTPTGPETIHLRVDAGNAPLQRQFLLTNQQVHVAIFFWQVQLCQQQSLMNGITRLSTRGHWRFPALSQNCLALRPHCRYEVRTALHRRATCRTNYQGSKISVPDLARQHRENIWWLVLSGYRSFKIAD